MAITISSTPQASVTFPTEPDETVKSNPEAMLNLCKGALQAGLGWSLTLGIERLSPCDWLYD